MANVANNMPDDVPTPITVFSYAGIVAIPTENYGTLQVTAVGGVVESRPTGNPFVLFTFMYYWTPGGEYWALEKPIEKYMLNTHMAAMEIKNFHFPEPQVQADDPSLLQAQAEAEVMAADEGKLAEEGYEEIDEGDDDEVGDLNTYDDSENEIEEDALAESSHSEEEISW